MEHSGLVNGDTLGSINNQHLVNNNNNNNTSSKTNHQTLLNQPSPQHPSQSPHPGTPSGLGVGGGGTEGTPEMNGSASAPVGRGGGTGGPGSVTVKSCAGCGARIVDRFLLHAMDRYWHTGCLKCSCCQAQLGEIGTSCFTKSGMILCKNDYIRLFGSSGTCSACSQSIPASEFVMKAQNNVYHLNCFTCVACSNRLVPGDRYSLVNGQLVCEHDYPKVVKGHTQIPLSRSTTHKVC